MALWELWCPFILRCYLIFTFSSLSDAYVLKMFAKLGQKCWVRKLKRNISKF